MRFHVLTLFPDMIRQGCDNSILKRAMEKGLVHVCPEDIRDHTTEKHGKVDDYTYGGGAGMLMQAQPVYDAWQHVCGGKKLRTIYVTPQGSLFTQELAKEFAKEEELVILCGHYEGIDERALDEIGAERISIGDYVLTGGELPAMVMIDAISRLIPGVLGSDESAETESLEGDLLEYPQYSRPEVWHGKSVPAVLLSGDHAKIRKWRTRESEKRTKKVRPDLYEKYKRRQDLIKLLMKQKKENAYMIDCLMRDTAEVICADGAQVLARDKKTDNWMICCDDLEAGEKLLSLVPKDCKRLIHNFAPLNEKIKEVLGLEVGDECFQSVYTQKNLMSISHKDIRPYPMEALEYAAANYGTNSGPYIADRIKAGEFFAAYDGDKIAGFCGVHAGGSLGLLYVDPAYRRTSIGSSLASYLVNLALERGGFPYAHIRISNEASVKMQEKMGLYVGKRTIFWTYRKDF